VKRTIETADDHESISACLSGKVCKRTLPQFEVPPGPNAPALKRLLLPQGELAQLHDGDEPIQYLAFIELRAGTVRGNHFHKFKKEYCYILQGEILLVVEDTESKSRESLQLVAGQLVTILPGVAHSLRVVKSGQAIEFSPLRFDRTDTYPYPLT
jgi:mannose-6-phosphate isomerase-like protein (cupin superfamily)